VTADKQNSRSPQNKHFIAIQQLANCLCLKNAVKLTNQKSPYFISNQTKDVQKEIIFLVAGKNAMHGIRLRKWLKGYSQNDSRHKARGSFCQTRLNTHKCHLIDQN
jgi:hypothetical protein